MSEHIPLPKFPPLPVQNIKPLEERVAEAMLLRGKISEANLHTILNAIYGSARDCGEYSLDVSPPCESTPEIVIPGIPTIKHIQTVVAEHFNLKWDEMLSKHRFKWIARPRQIAMYLCKKLTGRSFPEIGRRFGRHHTTIMYAVRKITRLIKNDNGVAEEIAALKEMVMA